MAKTPVPSQRAVANYQENVTYLEQRLATDKNFDIRSRALEFGGKRFNLFFVDGMIKDHHYLDITRSLSMVERKDLVPSTLEKLVKTYISYVQVETQIDLEVVVTSVLAGRMAIVVDNEPEIILIEARQYPARQPEEPDLEKVVRGSRDGFTETIIFNTVLIRRRIRDPRLRTVMVKAGSRSQTDICITYIEDVANPDLVEDIKKRISKLEIDGLPMAEKSVEEMITKDDNPWNPFPQVRYTERPDVAAAHLFEGHVLIIVDTSPSIMIAPTTLFHHVQHAEEYRQAPVVGAYIRWVRFIAIVASLIILPLYLAVSLNPGLLPESLKFIGPEKMGSIPLALQFFIAEIGIDMVRMAAIHTPSPLATALGLIAAFMIGDVAIQIGLFAPETIMYLALAAVGSFATPSYELAMALRLWRLAFIAAVWALGIWGLALGLGVLFFFLLRSKSFGVPYLWPLVPFNWSAMKAILVRYPVPIQNSRPSIVKPQDPDRQPTSQKSVPVPARKLEFKKVKSVSKGRRDK